MPSMTETASPKTTPAAPESRDNLTEVFAVHGADPEVLAYAMAKYSRSALSMKESLREISSQKAEQFLNTFYFQYGHRSIADLAHIAFAVERLSLLAAIVLVDEQRWDGQERSTRYQNFRKSGWYLPDFGSDAASASHYRATIEQLFSGYHSVFEAVFASLQKQVPRPDDMKQESYERTLKARAFDVARYLLPLATNTSLGQIVNARTLETQVSRLLSHPAAEVRQLGARLQAAASGPAWNVHAEDLAVLQQDIAALDPALGERAAALLNREVKTAPTLVKYAAVNDYQVQTRMELRQAAAELLGTESIDDAPLVDLIDDVDSLEIDLATTLLYGQCHYPYRQIRRHVAALGGERTNEIVDLGIRHRGRHDELLREFAAGHALRFDILMDIGGFRDMHRHRRCIQVLQEFTADHGYAIPEGVPEAGVQPLYEETIRAAHNAFVQLAAGSAPESVVSAQYVLPLGTRNRALFKMDFSEALYISELRSAPQGHFSYRKVAWEMFLAVERRHPALAKYFRVTNADQPIDLLKR
jgi:thymidylate synthase ThyX